LEKGNKRKLKENWGFEEMMENSSKENEFF